MKENRSPYTRARTTTFPMVALVLVALALPAVALAGGPQYDSDKCRATVEKMVEAHGGLESWKKSPAISFSSHLKVDFGADNWVPYWEEVTVETPTRRAYLKLPNPDGTAGQLAFDGKKAWKAGAIKGLGNAPARFTAWRNFDLFNPPWMTQDSGVHLAEAGKGTIPGDSKDYTAVKMTFDDGTGDTPKDHYKLFIDPATNRLHAAEYVMTFPGNDQRQARVAAVGVRLGRDADRQRDDRSKAIHRLLDRRTRGGKGRRGEGLVVRRPFR